MKEISDKGLKIILINMLMDLVEMGTTCIKRRENVSRDMKTIRKKQVKMLKMLTLKNMVIDKE